MIKPHVIVTRALIKTKNESIQRLKVHCVRVYTEKKYCKQC